MKNILIADDHPITLRGIRELLSEAYPELSVRAVTTMDAVLQVLPEQAWDLILLDIMMPGISVLDALQRIRAHSSEVPILILTGAQETEFVLQTMKAGANGLIHKQRAADDLLHAVRIVAAGGSYLHAQTAHDVAQVLRESAKGSPHDKLSERELEIFRLIALGRAIKEIAGDLNLSDKTVATYLNRIREKTGLTSHVDIARYALRHGLVD